MLWKLTIIQSGWDDDNTAAYCAGRGAQSILIVADTAKEAVEKVKNYMRENKGYSSWEIYPHCEVKDVSSREIFFLAKN